MMVARCKDYRTDPIKESKALSLIISTLLLLAGCAVGSNYQRPALDVPDQFRSASPFLTTNTLAELPWWEFFKDPALTRAALSTSGRAKSEFLSVCAYGARA
jgi:hypothetical protein